MIQKERIKELVTEAIAGTDIFLVDLKVSADNKITVYLDNSTRISIEDCARVNRFLEAKLDRNVEDFELTVSSPGLEEPFRHLMQYKKRIGSQVAVITKEGQKLVGKLHRVDDNGIMIEQKSTEKVSLSFDQIKESKLVVSF